jgi:hypothetical protein
MSGSVNLGQEDKEGAINTGEVDGFIKEGCKDLENVGHNGFTERRVKSWPEAIRTRAGQLVHSEERRLNFLGGEGGT